MKVAWNTLKLLTRRIKEDIRNHLKLTHRVWWEGSNMQTQPTPTLFCDVFIKETSQAFVHCPYFCYDCFFTNQIPNQIPNKL
jgi:hypothetical protein